MSCCFNLLFEDFYAFLVAIRTGDKVVPVICWVHYLRKLPQAAKTRPLIVFLDRNVAGAFTLPAAAIWWAEDIIASDKLEFISHLPDLRRAELPWPWP